MNITCVAYVCCEDGHMEMYTKHFYDVRELATLNGDISVLVYTTIAMEEYVKEINETGSIIKLELIHV